MRYYEVAPTIIIHNEHAYLTYSSSVKLAIGAIVSVEIGKKVNVAIVYKETTKPLFATKSITLVIVPQPLPLHLLKTAVWMSHYDSTSLASVLLSMLPRGIAKKRRNSFETQNHPHRKRTHFLLNDDQNRAVHTIEAINSGTVLLQGVTGSGKTAVYIEAVRKSLERNQSSIILVPEIALTPQLVADFSQHFLSSVVVTHSTMTEAERHLVWLKCLTTEKPLIVIGPRSALFAPLHDLGLIVIDECHEPSYKQEQAPRYSSLRVASMITRFAEIKTVFGSATPNIVDTYLAKHAVSPIIKLPVSAQSSVVKSHVTVVDATKKDAFTRHRFFSTVLINALEQSLKNSTQSMIFHNRRGSAPITLCEACGWTAVCPACFIPLTLHTDTHQLKCHTCGHKGGVPPHCPICREPSILHRGIGTKIIESELRKLFPRATIARYDTDTVAAEQLHKQYQQLYDGGIDIIIGTQMIAKGLDLPHLRTVGIVQADSGLAMPDYQSEERVFQLIYQVSGRVGRNAHKTQVIVQTYQPTHPSIHYGVTQDYEGFYAYALAKRHQARFPPFTHLLKLTCSYATERGAIAAATKLSLALKDKLGSTVHVFGPAPSFYERLGAHYRWQLVVKSSSRKTLLEATQLVPKSHWFIDLDPANLL